MTDDSAERFDCPCCGGEGCEDGEDDWGCRHYQECVVCDGSGSVDAQTFEALKGS